MSGPQTSPASHIALSVGTGPVRDCTSWVDTQVRVETRGGGGYLHQGTGHIRGPETRVESTSVPMTRFFIDIAGREFDFTLASAQFPVRTGHLVSIVLARASERHSAAVVGYLNHTTRHLLRLPNSALALRDDAVGEALVPAALTASAVMGGPWLLDILGLVPWPFSAFFLDNALLWGAITGGVYLPLVIHTKSRANAFDADLFARAEALLNAEMEAQALLDDRSAQPA